MKELTVGEIEEKEMTFEDVMNVYKPDITEQEVDYILWNETCYPFDNRLTLKQIYDYLNPTHNE